MPRQPRKEDAILSVREVLEALGEVNRYYAWLKLGREPTVKECLDHYLLNFKTTQPFLPFNEGRRVA